MANASFNDPSPEAPGAALHLRAVGRSFAASGPVVEAIDLALAPGEFAALLGPSGCGKSTLLRLAAGLDRPDRGSVEADSLGREHFRAFVFQDPCLLPWRTSLENAALPLELLGHSRASANREAEAALKKVGLGDALHFVPSQLSGGMRMRVSLARALVGRPSLLLLDEPFAALDENSRHSLQDDLRRLWESSGMTVLFVTHSVAEAVFLAERAVVLSPRPARVLLDRRIDLPSPRPLDCRLSADFLRETKTIYQAYAPGARAGEAAR